MKLKKLHININQNGVGIINKFPAFKAKTDMIWAIDYINI